MYFINFQLVNLVRQEFYCGPDHGIMPDVPLENVLAMYDEARKFRF